MPISATRSNRGLLARQTGQSARFLTVIEPYENKSVIKSVEATSPGSLTITLKDGRVHTFNISGMDSSEGDINVEMTKTQDGETLSEEDTL